MNISIRPARVSDLKDYTSMMQQTYVHAYVDDSIGLTENCFSVEVFASPDTQAYLRSKLVSSQAQQSWLAENDVQIAGGIVIEDKGETCELTGFYVLPHFQGQGIGKKLWQKALQFAKNKDITLDIYAHNKATIEVYKHWGFAEDTSQPHFYRHWPEWPAGLQAECLYMRRSSRLA